MRLDARKGHYPWNCWDAKRCCAPEHVVWVDDETAQWGQYIKQDREFIRVNGRVRIDVHQEDKITIYPDRRLVVFNEIPDCGDEAERKADEALA